MKRRAEGVRDALAAFRRGLPVDLLASVRWDGLDDAGNLRFASPCKAVVVAVRKQLALGLNAKVVVAADGWVDLATVRHEPEYGRPWPSPDADGERNRTDNERTER